MGRKRSIEEFKKEASLIHKGIYNYDFVLYKNTDKKVIIVCPVHGEFLQTPYNHIKVGQGCPQCAKNVKFSNEEVDKKLKYRKIKRIDDYINSITPITFQCLNDDCNYVWKTRPSSILNHNTGCAKCSLGIKYTNDDLDKRLSGKNIERIGEYKNAVSPILFKCLVCEFIWSTKPNHIMNMGIGCPMCSSPLKNEKLVYNLLLKHDLDFEYQKKLKELAKHYTMHHTVDFYLPSINTIIEYNGEQHYRPVRFGTMSKEEQKINFNRQVKRDRLVEKFCTDLKIKLIVIDGRIYKKQKLEDYLLSEIIPSLRIHIMTGK